MSSKQNAPGPVIILSYPYSGARFVQTALVGDGDVACTVGMGVLRQCHTVAVTWSRIHNQAEDTLSSLALSSIRTLVNAQVMVILAGTGRGRWCELATNPQAAETFLRIVPSARFVCVYRSCLPVVGEVNDADPAELNRASLRPFAAYYPGDRIAAATAYWISVNERLLAFEKAHPEKAIRLRHEDVIADSRSLSSVRSALNMREPAQPEMTVQEPAAGDLGDLHALLSKIPGELRPVVDDLHAQLGYRHI